jgi:transglutaminase-like putative cysteine protease
MLLAAVAVTGNGLLTSAVHAQGNADPTTTATPAADRFRLPAVADLTTDATRSVIDIPPDPGEEIDLGPVMEATASLVAALPEAEWDAAALAATLPDVTSAFELVRDGIAFDAYRGVLRGDAGTLAARAGDSFDRAMLLRALLDAQGATSRYAIGTLDAETAEALVARSLVEPTDPLPAMGYSPIDDTLEVATEARARRDHALLVGALGDDLAGVAADGTAAALDDVTRHAWVQVAQSDGTWLDLDPTLPDAAPGDVLTTPDETSDAFAQTDMHMVRIRLAAEHLRSGALSEDWYLDTVLPAWVLDDEQVILTFTPAGGDGGLLNPGGLLGGGGGGGPTAWSPVLFIGSDAAYGTDIVFSGQVGGGGLLGPGEQADLASLALEVTTTAPGGETRVVRQTLADRVAPELRSSGSLTPEQLAAVADDEGTPAILRNVTHLMVSTGGANPRHQAVDLAFAAQMAAWGSTTEDPGAILAADAFQPMAALDRSLVLASERRFIPAIDDAEVRAFVAQPRIVATTSSIDLGDPSVSSFRTDLMIDGVRTLTRDGAPADAAARRQLWYGALEGALETELVLSGAGLLDSASRVLASASFDTTGPLTVLSDGDGQIPAAADASLAEILAAGGLAVVPGDVATAHTWWEIGRDGSTRSVIAPRLGSSIRRGAPNPNSPLTRVQPKPGSNPGGGHQQGRRGPGERGMVEQAVVPAAETTGKQVGYSNASKFVEASVQLMKNGSKFPKF